MKAGRYSPSPGFGACGLAKANDVVRPIPAKAMPVLLTTAAEWDIWLGDSIEEATALQRSLPNNALSIVATGEKSDAAPAESAVGAGR